MTTIKKINVLSLAKIYGLLCVITGLVIAIFVVWAMSRTPLLPSIDGSLVGPSVGSLILTFILIPIGYGLLGFIMGAVGALLYNLCAKYVGGIQIEIDKK